MALQTLTRALANAAAMDAANRHMRKHGRAVWDASDFDVACDTLARLDIHTLSTAEPVKPRNAWLDIDNGGH